MLLGPEQAAYSCTLGIPCILSITGAGLTASSRLALVGSAGCGSADVVSWASVAEAAVASTAAVYMLGTPLAGTPGSSYSLCWSHVERALEDFVVAIDPGFVLAGPHRGSFHCALGDLGGCAVLVAGRGLAPASGLVALSSGACGDADAVAYANATADLNEVPPQGWSRTAECEVVFVAFLLAVCGH